jgi:hypothetical protein
MRIENRRAFLDNLMAFLPEILSTSKKLMGYGENIGMWNE